MNRPQTLALAPGVIAEDMGDCFLVMVPGRSEVVTLRGPAVDVIRAAAKGSPLPPASRNCVDHLIHAGVVAGTVSRRSLLGAGAIVVGAGIVALSMPSVAAASSSGGPIANTTRFDVAFTGRSTSGENYTKIDVALNENGALVTEATIPRGTPATVILSGGTELNGAFYANDDDAFSFMNLAVARNLVENLTHTLSFSLAGERYEVSFTGPDW